MKSQDKVTCWPAYLLTFTYMVVFIASENNETQFFFPVNPKLPFWQLKKSSLYSLIISLIFMRVQVSRIILYKFSIKGMYQVPLDILSYCFCQQKTKTRKAPLPTSCSKLMKQFYALRLCGWSHPTSRI